MKIPIGKIADWFGRIVAAAAAQAVADRLTRKGGKIYTPSPENNDD